MTHAKQSPDIPPSGECTANLDTDEMTVPRFDVLVVANIALMTTWADMTQDDERTQQQRNLIARKIVSNLFFMLNHPCAQGAMSAALTKAHAHWISIARRNAGTLDDSPSLDAHRLH